MVSINELYEMHDKLMSIMEKEEEGSMVYNEAKNWYDSLSETIDTLDSLEYLKEFIE